MNNQVFRLSDLPDPLAEQQRMRQLSVFNWGTFSGLHRMPVAHEGMLLLGPSGAGKSTLLDAISALTVAPRTVRFNAAADESARKDHDRSLMSYVRGAWADRADEDSPQSIAKQYLRPRSTWSAIALDYANSQGRQVSLVRVMWVRGAATSGPVESHFMVVEGVFDLAQIPDFQGERRNLKKALNGANIRHHEQSFSSFSENWCRVLGIPDPNALQLLHQTQSTKNLSDLNAFLRDFMLAEPQTFSIAQELVNEFVDLDEAHKAVVAARKQVQMLEPARQAHLERSELLARQEQTGALLKAIPAFRASILARLLGEHFEALQTQSETAQAELDQAKSQLGSFNTAIVRLEAEFASKGGAELSGLAEERQRLETERGRTLRFNGQAQQAAKVLGWSLASDATSFVAQVQSARNLVENAVELTSANQRIRDEAAVREDRIGEAFRALQIEIRSLESSTSSIPLQKQSIRSRLCDELGISPQRVKFAGELIDVKPEHGQWAGAANRLLGGFGTTMLVHEEDYRKIVAWVDKSHLGDRLFYNVASSSLAPDLSRLNPRSILHTLHVQPHAFRNWVLTNLSSNFNYECVDSPADLMKGERRITQAGQLRHNGRRHEKDDRREINDRRNWVLGDNREKLARFKEDSADLAAQFEQARQAKQRATEEATGLAKQQAAATSFSGFRWEDIDLGSVVERIERVNEQQRSIDVGNPELADVQGRLTDERQRLGTCQAVIAHNTNIVAKNAEELATLQSERQMAQIEAAMLSPDHASALIQRMPIDWAPSLKSYRTGIDQLSDALHEDRESVAKDIKSLEMKIVAIFGSFLHAWPAERGALQAHLESAHDFFSLLTRIENDGLPAHVERFMELLRTQSTQRLSELHIRLTDARRDIESRLDDVNTALSTVPYNVDSFLRLRVEDLGLPEPRDFRKRLSEVFQRQNAAATDTAEAELQFDDLRRLIFDLRADEPEQRRWRDLVLDVRRHVHFIADELAFKTEELIENYSGSGGKSGGQRQKLTATCLAAALRFQLGGTDGGPPAYAAVVLDEAFTKTDNEFTTTCMRIFTELGFQMIVATPIKSVMTLEPFVGGATYISISNRHTSSMQHIAYLTAEKRLDLPDPGKLER